MLAPLLAIHPAKFLEQEICVPAGGVAASFGDCGSGMSGSTVMDVL